MKMYQKFGLPAILTTAILLFTLRDSKAQYTAYPNWQSDDACYTMSVAAGDMDNDGYCDLVAGNYSYPYTSGDVTLNNAGDLETDAMGGSIVIYYQLTSGSGGLDTDTSLIWSGDAGVDKVILADMNNDGWLDIVAATVVTQGGDGEDFILYYADSTQTYRLNTINEWNPPSEDNHDIAVGDVDNDGRHDIVTCDVTGNITLWINENTMDTPAPFICSGSGQVIYEVDDMTETDIGYYPGRMIELADFTGDGRLDLLFNDEDGSPGFFINTGTSPFFSTSNIVKVSFDMNEEGKDMADCAAIGRYRFDGADYIAAVCGTMSHVSPESGHETRGSNLYIYYDSKLKEVLRTSGGSNDYMICSDIQMGCIDSENTIMDIVAAGYSNLDSDGDSWQNGKEQCFLLPNNLSDFDTIPPDWSSTNPDLSTSVALGQFDESGMSETQTISISYNVDRIYLKYINSPPVAKIDSVKTGSITVDHSNWCFDPKTGWISINKDFFRPNVTVTVYYKTWTDLDLAVGNDGVNVVYYNGGSGNITINPPVPGYDIPSMSYSPDTTALTTSLMDVSGAIGFVVENTDIELVGTAIEKLPDVDKACVWVFSSDLEDFKGHYYWDTLDKNLNALITAGKAVFIQVDDGQTGAPWSFPPVYDSHDKSIKKRPANQKLPAYFFRNLANRYREGGVMDNNAYGWETTEGVMEYMFLGDFSWGPDLGYYDYRNNVYYSDADSNVAIASRMFKYNYWMLKAIDDDITVFGPDMFNAWDDDSLGFVDTLYFQQMYDDNLGAPFKNYIDVLGQQTWLVDYSGVSPVDIDPVSTNLLNSIITTVDTICSNRGDSRKPLITKDFIYGTIHDPAIIGRYISHAAAAFAHKRFWRVYYQMKGNVDLDSYLTAVNNLAQLTKGCRFWTPGGGTLDNPNINEEIDEPGVIDYIFEDTTAQSYIHQLRTVSAYNATTRRISTVEDDSSLMDNHQAEIITMMGDSWLRPYGVYDSDSVYVKFNPSEIDTTPFWIKEVYDIPVSDFSVSSGLVGGQWRLVSFNVEPPSPSINIIFSGTDADYVKDYTDNEWPDLSLTQWTTTQGFMVHIPDDAPPQSVTVTDDMLYGETASIIFTPYDAGIDTVRERIVNYKRFYAAYLPQTSIPVNIAFVNLMTPMSAVIWIRNSEGQFYFPSYPNSSDNFLCHPGEGYDLNMSSMDTDTLIYNATGFTPDSWNGNGKNYTDNDSILSLESAHFVFKKCTQDLYPIIIDTLIVEGVTIEAGDELGVFTEDDICCGAKVLETGQTGFILTAWNDDIATEEKDGFEWEENMTFKFYDASLDTEFIIEELGCTISSANLIEAYTGGFGAGQFGIRSLNFDGPGYAVPNTYALHQNYPNPFNLGTIIRYDLPKESKVKLEIFNILGQKVAVLINQNQSAGYKTVVWDSDSFASGMYIYKIKAQSIYGNEDFSCIKKMILIK